MNIDTNEIKYKWDDSRDCNTIIYDSLIERLEEQIEHNNGFGKEDAENALTCIKWQKEERDRLLQKLQQVKVETIKEFVEKLKEIIYTHENRVDVDGIVLLTRIDNSIDNLVKEMTEVKENEKIIK